MEYQIMYYGGMAGAIITLILSIIFYFKMGIAQVVEDLFGIRLRKKKASRQNSDDEAAEKKFTKEIMIKKQYSQVAAAKEGLNHDGDSRHYETALMAAATEETALLGPEEIEETTLLTSDADETTVLSEEMDETTLLTEAPYFQNELDIVVVHSDTKI